MYGSIAKREKKIQIYTVLCSPSGNIELIEHELLKINLSKSHQICYRQTPTSVKKMLAFSPPYFMIFLPVGGKHCAYSDASHAIAKLPAVSMYANRIMC